MGAATHGGKASSLLRGAEQAHRRLGKSRPQSPEEAVANSPRGARRPASPDDSQSEFSFDCSGMSSRRSGPNAKSESNSVRKPAAGAAVTVRGNSAHEKDVDILANSHEVQQAIERTLHRSRTGSMTQLPTLLGIGQRHHRDRQQQKAIAGGSPVPAAAAAAAGGAAASASAPSPLSNMSTDDLSKLNLREMKQLLRESALRSGIGVTDDDIQFGIASGVGGVDDDEFSVRSDDDDGDGDSDFSVS